MENSVVSQLLSIWWMENNINTIRAAIHRMHSDGHKQAHARHIMQWKLLVQIGFTFLVPAHLGSPGKGAVKRVCVCV